VWWEFHFFQELLVLPGVFYKTDGYFVAFHFNCDDFIICPPATPLPTRRNRHTCTPHGSNPWVPIPISYSDHFGVAATLYIKYPRDVRDPTLSDHELRTAQKETPPISALSAPAPIQTVATEMQFWELLLPLFVRTCEAPIVRFRLRTEHWEAFLVTTTNWFPPAATPLVVLGGAVAT
jgi:hypothetical protein